MDENTIKFLDETKREMIAAGITLLLDEENDHVMSGGMRCAGYFGEEDKLEFACAIGRPLEEWLPIYVHEYAHFTQWQEQTPEWIGVDIDGLEYDDFLHDWLTTDKKFSKDTVTRMLDSSIAVESDCDRRAMKLIEKYNLPIDLDVYAQTANAYSHFYNYIKLNRKWYEPGKAPYTIPEVYSQFSTVIDDEFPISYEYMDLIEKHCF